MAEIFLQCGKGYSHRFVGRISPKFEIELERPFFLVGQHAAPSEANLRSGSFRIPRTGAVPFIIYNLLGFNRSSWPFHVTIPTRATLGSGSCYRALRIR